MNFERYLAAIAGLFGAAGIGLLAIAAHGQWPAVNYSAIMMLAHAVALLALAAALRAGLLNRAAGCLGGAVLAVCVLLFSGDVTLLAMTGGRLFAYAAPIGGTGAMAGWLILALAAFLPVRTPRG